MLSYYRKKVAVSGWKSWAPGALVRAFAEHRSPATPPLARLILTQELAANRGHRQVMFLVPLMHVWASWAVLQCTHQRARPKKTQKAGRNNSRVNSPNPWGLVCPPSDHTALFV